MNWDGSSHKATAVTPKKTGGDPEWCGVSGRPHAAESPSDLAPGTTTKPKGTTMTAPSTSQGYGYASWGFLDTYSKGSFVAQVLGVSEVAAGEHAGKKGVWFKQIKERRACSEDWELLKTLAFDLIPE